MAGLMKKNYRAAFNPLTAINRLKASLPTKQAGVGALWTRGSD